MKLGVISQNFMQFEFEEGLRQARDLGFQAMEVGACGLWGAKFCEREKLLADPGEIRRWLDAFARHDLEISSLGGHGATLLPDEEAAAEYSRQFRQTCELMEKASIQRLTLLAGLPEGAEGGKAPDCLVRRDDRELRAGRGAAHGTRLRARTGDQPRARDGEYLPDGTDGPRPQDERVRLPRRRDRGVLRGDGLAGPGIRAGRGRRTPTRSLRASSRRFSRRRWTAGGVRARAATSTSRNSRRRSTSWAPRSSTTRSTAAP